MTRRQKRKIAIIIVLALLLLFLSLYFLYFRATKRLDFDFAEPVSDSISIPQYLYSISGPDDNRLIRPIGVYVDDEEEEVYVTDVGLRKVLVFELGGEFKRIFGGEELVVPLYLARNPVDGNMYVSDRRTRSIHIYTPEGEYLEDFDPSIPATEIADFAPSGTQWAPVALTFAEDGTLYVTELLTGHRFLSFSPEGDFEKSVGTVGLVADATAGEELFQFPNSIKVRGEETWVADSNNRRLQVFSRDGEFKKIIVTDGLPRGFDFLNRSEDASATDKVVVVDTLAHDATIWNVEGEKLLNFGERGVLEGQFQYPNDLSIGPKNLIFITDSANARVQVWGWPEEVSPIPIPAVAQYWRWCFAPLLLLPLLLLFRRKRFFATKEFVDTMLELELVEHMPARRRTWQVTEHDYELLKDYTQGDVDLGELLHPTEYSDSDAKSLMDKLEIEHDIAIILAIAQRAHVFCNEDMELRRLAKTLEIDVVDHEEFMERFADSDSGDTDSPVTHDVCGNESEA